MIKTTIDFETRSQVDLRKIGHWPYAEHESTEALLLAVKTTGYEKGIWIWEPWIDLLPDFHGLNLLTREQILERFNASDIIEAHNSGFEIAIWHHILHKRYDWPKLPFSKLRCSAAKAAMHALPRDLEGAGKALGLPIKKDIEGHKLMLQMCKPRKPSKHNPAEWWETPEKILKLSQYCITDVDSEECLSDNLRDLPAKELEIWRLDQIINARGIQADIPSIEMFMEMILRQEIELLREMECLTNGEVSSPKQVSKTLKFLATCNCHLDNLQKATVAEALDIGVEHPFDRRLVDLEVESPTARRILEIRQALSKSSTAKYESMLKRANADGRIRGTLMYHGASTGRWTGKGIQPQNLPRGSFEDVEACIALAEEKDDELMETFFGSPMDAASTCIRGMLTSGPGKILICGDLASIEGCVLAWLAKEIVTLEHYRAGKRMYCVAASAIYKMPYEELYGGRKGVHKKKDAVGKVAELAFGYQGGQGAVQAMAEQAGVEISETEAEHMKTAWRESRTQTVKLWYGLEEVATQAVASPGSVFSYNGIAYGVKDNFLCCKLPSGRVIRYYDPTLVETIMPWGGKKKQIRFWGVDSYTRQWKRQSTYGGKLTENVVQAIARDIIADAMLRVEKAKYPVVLSVHDELLSEVVEGFGSVEEYVQLMSVVPGWAEGCPIAATGWTGHRYKKD